MGDQRKKSRLAGIGAALAGEAAVSAFPALFLYFRNADEADFSEALPATLVFILAGLVLFGIVLLLVRKPAKAGLVTCLFMLVFSNYALIESAVRGTFPALRYWHIVPVLLVILLQASHVFCRKLPDEISGILMTVIACVFCALIVVNGAAAAPTIAARARSKQDTVQYTANAEQPGGSMPNIYYLLFDEYSSDEFMLEYYDYDNSALTGRLEKRGFAVSRHSHNESTSTLTVTTNLMNLDYIVSDSTPAYEREQARKNGKLFGMLADSGYSLYSLTDIYGLPLIDDQGTKSQAVTASGDTLGSILLKNTVLYPLTRIRQQGIRSSVDSIKRFIREKKKNRFLMVHLNLPHQPFMYDRDGNILRNVNSDWKDKKYYLDQFIYASKVMEELADYILENDPDSIIFLQSDHSARASTDPDLYGIVYKIEDMTNCFNCVYYRGEDLEIEGLSGVNTGRLVFGRLLGGTLPPVEVPVPEFDWKAEE